MAQLRAARWLWMPLLLFVITRFGVALIAYLAAPLVADSSVPPYHIRPDHTLLDVFGSRWDTGFYLSIAAQGYQYEGAQFPSVAFFPLLPLLIRAVTPIVGDPLIAGVLIANAALLGASIVVYRLAEEMWGTAVADRAAWYLLIFPTSFFGSAIYTESLFLLGAAGALYAARHGRWGIAALLGFLTGLTRLMGLAVAPMLAVEWWMQRRQVQARAKPSSAALLAPLAVVAGMGVYMLYLQWNFGDPLAFVHASEAWERQARSPIETIAELLRPPAEGWASAIMAGRLPLDNWIDLLVALGALGLGIVLLRRRRWSEAVFVVLGALIPLSSGLLMSQRRYVWTLFPVFFVLAQWGERPWLDRTITTLSLLGLGLFTALFANWYWVG